MAISYLFQIIGYGTLSDIFCNANYLDCNVIK